MVRSIPITEDRIRELAYRLWLEDGQPQGKSGKHWQKARKLLVLEADTENGQEDHGKSGPAREAVGEGRLPTMTAQDEQKLIKKRPPDVARKSTRRRPM